MLHFAESGGWISILALGTEGKCLLLLLAKAEFLASQHRDPLPSIKTPAIQISHCTVPRPRMHRQKETTLASWIFKRENIRQKNAPDIEAAGGESHHEHESKVELGIETLSSGSQTTT